MAVKKFKPVTPSQRFHIGADFSIITAKKPEKSLLYKLHKTGGRNNKGKMTNRQQGGGHKRRGRLIDWRRQKLEVPALVKSIEYDPNRSAYIALLHYKDGAKAYIIAPNQLLVGSKIVSGQNVSPEIGNAMPLQNMPMGTIVHNIEMRPKQGAILVRSAGAYAQIVAKEGLYVTIKLPSKERRKILASCWATVGAIGNSDHHKERLGKAGRNRWLGNRPRVRGVAMNPVDHPLGGGSGGKGGGKHPVSRNGLPSLGAKTRNPKKKSTKYIIESARK